MADECTLVVETELAVNFTCADGTGIPKGSVLELNDNATVTITNGDTDPVIGIAAEEKVADDGKTTLGVYMGGIFRGTSGAGGTTVGLNITTDTATGSANELVTASGADEQLVGRALETATDRQTFLFKLAPFNFDIA